MLSGSRPAHASEPAGRNGVRERPLVRILAVDDDPQAVALIEMALADASFEYALEVAPTASVGRSRIAVDEHDVYLVDQQLPDGQGVDLIHNAKIDGSSKPFILMTGHGSGALDEAASREGAADYVEKHMVAAQLERSIRYALRNWQSTRMLHDREEQLRQAQKMEAIGRLAGGVAHDFNNILTAIIGYTDLLADRVSPDDATARDISEIRKAADRAAVLTRQLLAFSRKQFLDPTVLDLNDVIGGLLQMLPRVIGEHIQVTTMLGSDLAHVRADASQMEQVFINLVLNARDAMPIGGHIEIETANLTLDRQRVAAEALSIPPGDYVTLRISDTGHGMDDSTLARAFEPFFTTKPKGKGTGLGLATVYGIVDQSGGQVSLKSAQGRGTTVRIYLPATDAPADARKPELAPASEDRGTETILLVEDNDAVRDLSVKALRQRGYAVHEARDAEEAIAWAVNSGIRANLLVTDIVMPGLSGPNLAARLLQENPRLRVLYMSGYTDEANAVQGAYLAGVPLLQKPFTPARLAERVRSVLDASHT